MAEDAHFDAELDTSGLKCPYPLLQVKKSLKTLTSGQILLLISTDPATLEDIKGFVAQTGHHLLLTRQDQNTFHFWIQKA